MFERHKKLIVTLAVLLLWTIFFPFWRQHLLQAPLNVPISISPPGSVREIIHIPLAEEYILVFAFARTGVSNEKIRQFVGQGYNYYRGVPIAVRWEVYSLPEKELVEKREVESIGSHASIPATMTQPATVIRLIDSMILKPGDYEIVATVVRDVPEFADFSTKIGLRLDSGKDAPRTWQRILIQWVWLLFLEPAVWLLDIILAIVLSVRIWRGRNLKC